jgi:hypothetical protein
MSELILIEILAVPAKPSRGRHHPRAVKRKMSNFPTKARAAPAPRQVFRCAAHIRVVAPTARARWARWPRQSSKVPAQRRPTKVPRPSRHGPPWLEHVRAWQASGLSRTASCERHGLNPRAFHRWVAFSRHILRRNACSQPSDA